MDYFTLLLLSFLFLMALFYLFRRTCTSGVTAKPPSPPSLPLIGHLHLLMDMPHITFTNLASKLNTGMIYLHLGQVPTVVISTARLAKLVFTTYDHIFSNRPQLLSAKYLSFNCSDVTFSPYGPYWRQARKIYVTELLSAKRVNLFSLIREEEVNILLTSILVRLGSEVDMSELFFKVANDVLCRVAFGRRFVEGGQKGNLVSVLLETQALFAGFCLGDFFPMWDWVNTLSGYRTRLIKNLKELQEVCDGIIGEHLKREKYEFNCYSEDFVDVLIRVQKQDDLDVPISDNNLKALVLDMFVAGTDTTSATMEWTMTELALHPAAMKKAQEEVRRVASSKGRVDENDLQHFRYLKATIKEAMRLHPAVPLLVPRESTEKCILDGYELPARTRVMMNSYAIMRDPELWQNPLEYKPERFLENEIDFKDQDFRFLPFGGGRRGCPGYSFGLATIEITLARLLYHFDWELPAGIRPEDIDLSEVFGLATRKKVALVLVPTVSKGYEFKRSE